jgi:hypothetical protein
LHPPRLVRERFEEVPAAAESHAEFLYPGERAVPRDVRLARIGEAMTEPTGEKGLCPAYSFRGASAAAVASEPGRGTPGKSQPKKRGASSATQARKPSLMLRIHEEDRIEFAQILNKGEK